MSRYFSKKLDMLSPYVPGEQPGDSGRFIKLNTNESPYSPSPRALEASRRFIRDLRLYPDPEGTKLKERLAEIYSVEPENIILGNGSDEILFFAFRAFCDDLTPAIFPDITYGFYPVFSRLCLVPYRQVPLKEDFSVSVPDFLDLPGTLFIANPNAPTGRALSLKDIDMLLKNRPDFVTVLDEAYIDFGGESATALTKKYKNLLITQTFSKSRSLAGARVGFAIGDGGLISDLNRVKYSLNPYNVNSLSQALALGMLSDEEETIRRCLAIRDTREDTAGALKKLGFKVIPSKANFIFAMHPLIGGGMLYRQLKDRGILVRHFEGERTEDFIRISIGLPEDMKILLKNIQEIIDSEVK